MEKNSGTIYDQDDATVTAETFFPDIKTRSGSVLFYARWQPNVLTVHYHVNGGQVAPESETYYGKNGLVYHKADDTLCSNSYKYENIINFYNCTTLHIFRENFRFLGWGVQPDSKTVLGEDEKLTVPKVCPDITKGDQEINVYALWEPVQPEVSLYENKSGINYLLDSNCENIKGQTLKYGEVSTYTVKSENTHNGANVLSINVFQDDETMGTRQFSADSSLANSAPYTGVVSGTGKYYLSCYAKAPVNGAQIGVRFGYGGFEKTTKLTMDWQWYSFELSSNNITDRHVHFHFSKAGTYELSHLMLTDEPVKEEDFSVETETAPMTVLKMQKNGEFAELPQASREGYTFKGWYTKRVGGKLVTVPEKNRFHILYAQWTETATTTTTTTTSVTTTTSTTTTTTTTTVPELAIEPDFVTLAVGEKHTIKANQSNLTFKSSNPDVAIVSKNGVVTAISEGTAQIFVINADGDTAILKVTVIAAILSGDLNDDNKIDVKDAVLMARLAGNDSTLKLSNTAKKSADVNGDNIIDTADLQMLLNKIVGKE